MQLHLSRGEKKGMLGGRKYTLTAHLELTPDERALMKKHKLEKHQFYVAGAGWDNAPWEVNPSWIFTPFTFQNQELGLLLELESAIKDGCKSLNTRMKVTEDVLGANNQETISFD